jgi:four helix bundle protein
MQDFRKLKVWQRAQDACVRIYRATADYPIDERYGLTSQLRRAGVSVGANLAEGAKRSSKADKRRLWEVALGSAAEIMSELDVAVRLRYPNNEEGVKLAREYDEIAAMLNGLIDCLKGDDKK